MLGNSIDAFDQTWHLPTAGDPPTAQEWINMAAELLETKSRAQVMTPMLAGILGLFVPVLKEVKEMMYQYEADYVFNSDKFNKAFNFNPTPYRQGLEELITADFSTRA